MLELMSWLEGSALAEAIRGSGVWTYGILNLIHVLGLSTLFGSVLVLDLRLLGFWSTAPLSQISKPTVPLAATGLAVAVASGVCMISVNATEYYGNPFLYLKFPAIGVAMLNVGVLQFLTGWRARNTRELSSIEQRHLAVAGGISLLSWLTVIAAGRMIAYW